MLKEIQLLKDAGPIEKFICEIKFLASKGKTSWVGFIPNGWEVSKYFREQGFKVSRDRIIYTISWNDEG